MSALKRYFGNRSDPTPVTSESYVINELARFRILMGGIGASTCMSIFYGFNLISTHMMVRYDFSSQDLTAITTVGSSVGFVTLPGGMLLDYAGPMYVCMCALVVNTLGTLMMGLAFDDIFKGSVPIFSVFSALMNIGAATFDTGSLMAVMGSFPLNRGSCVAIMKTFAGIGASIFAVLNYSFFREKYSAYMYFLTAVVVFFGSIAVALIRFPAYHIVECEKKRLPMELQTRRRLTQRAYLTQRPPMQRFYYGYTVIITLVIYLTVQSLCVAYAPGMTDSKRMGICVGCICLVFLLFVVGFPIPFLGGMGSTYSAHYPEIPESLRGGQEASSDSKELKGMHVTEGVVHKDGHHTPSEQPATTDDTPTVLVTSPDAVLAVTDEDAVNLILEMDMDPSYQTTFLQNLRGIDLWLCWFNTLATWGCGIVISMNSAQIYRALSNGAYDIKLNTLYSAMIGVGSASGRLALGFFESWMTSRPVEGRPVITIVYPISSISMVLGMTLLLVLPPMSKAVILGFFFDAFGNGFAWASTAVTIRTLFAKDVGKHYTCMYLGAVVSVICLNRLAYGVVYDREASRQRDAAIEAGVTPIYPFCAGKKCVMIPFGVLLAVNGVSIFAALLVHLRYRKFVLKHRAARKAAAAEAAASAEPYDLDE